MISSKVGMAKRESDFPSISQETFYLIIILGSTDPEFDDYCRHFGILEQMTEKLIKDTKVFTEAVICALPYLFHRLSRESPLTILSSMVHAALFTSGTGFATHFSTIFHPIAGEYDLIGKHPEADLTVRSVDAFQSTMEELRATIGPELELIESRITGPTKEFQGVLKLIRKSITKREHKVCTITFYGYRFLGG
jgi:amphiphysin